MIGTTTLIHKTKTRLGTLCHYGGLIFFFFLAILFFLIFVLRQLINFQTSAVHTLDNLKICDWVARIFFRHLNLKKRRTHFFYKI